MILNYSGLSPSKDDLYLERVGDEQAEERIAYMEEVAKAHAAWVMVRDEFARLGRLHGVDEAAALEDCHSMLCDAASNIQGAVRRQYE